MTRSLMRANPYVVTGNGTRIVISLNQLSGFNPGDKYYQVKRSDGIIELVPEHLFSDQYCLTGIAAGNKPLTTDSE